jgi:hypothetical protein
MYIATAYRLGYRNAEVIYLVAIGTDKDAVIEQAEFEAAERASKYGVEVRRYTDSPCVRVPEYYDPPIPGSAQHDPGEVVHYCPSWRNETGLEYDERATVMRMFATQVYGRCRDNGDVEDIGRYALEQYRQCERILNRKDGEDDSEN